MASFTRRTGANILRTIARVLDPAAETAKAQLFSKNVGGTPQMFVRSPDFPRQISGLECSIWDRPLTPHALDDEFDSTTLNPAWTTGGAGWTNGGIDPFLSSAAGNALYELHTQRRPSWLMVQPQTSPAFITKNISSISGGDFFTWCRVSNELRVSAVADQESAIIFSLINNSLNNVNIIIGPNGANNITATFYRFVAGVVLQIGQTRNMFNGTSGMQPIEGCGIQKIGTNYHGWAFTGAGAAIWLGTTNVAFAVPSLSPQFYSSQTANPGNRISGIDFVRFKEGAVFLP